MAGLARHNDRAWFSKRKPVYERTVLDPMRRFVAETSAGLARAKIPIYGTPEHSIFRIYRDIRFSPDKRPFRTYAAAYLSRDARRATFGGCYLRIAPDSEESFLSVTFYLMGTPELRAWRTAIVEDRKGFARMLGALRRRGLALRESDDDDALARMPRGFESYRDDPLADYLRRRSFSIHRTLQLAEIEAPSLVDAAVRFVRDARPLLHFGWETLSRIPVERPAAANVNDFAEWVPTRRA